MIKRMLNWLCAHGIHPWMPVRYVECSCWASTCTNCGHTVPYSPSREEFRGIT